MKLFDYPEAKQVIVSGDIHGDFKTLVYKLCVQYECTDTLIIVAGDCGFGFEKPGYYNQVYNAVAGRLRKSNNWIVFVRGNHDNPAFFAAERATMDQIFQYIKYLGHPLNKWFYGHFHQSWNGLINDTSFSMLDIMEFKEV